MKDGGSMLIKSYRKKPQWRVVNHLSTVLALEFTGKNFDEIEAFCGDNCNIVLDDTGKKNLIIKAVEGDLSVKAGDMIIRGNKGEYYPCRIDIFKETYEEAN